MVHMRRGNNRSNQLLDRLLIPRLQNFAHSNDLTDIDSCVEYLRTNYKEYQRHKLAPFHNQVARAISIILKNSQEVRTHITVLLASTANERKYTLINYSSNIFSISFSYGRRSTPSILL